MYQYFYLKFLHSILRSQPPSYTIGEQFHLQHVATNESVTNSNSEHMCSKFEYLEIANKIFWNFWRHERDSVISAMTVVKEKRTNIRKACTFMWPFVIMGEGKAAAAKLQCPRIGNSLSWFIFERIEMIYFTSDLHLGHRGIIEMQNRPFENVQEMHQALVRN